MVDRRLRSSVYKSKVGVVKKCHLCTSDSPLNVYSKPSARDSTVAQQLMFLNHYIRGPSCCACEKFIKCYKGKDNIIPHWLPKEARSKAHSYCMVKGCGDVSHTTSSITYEVAREHLDLSQEDPTISPPTLCNSHYQHLYHSRVQVVPLSLGMGGIYTSLSRF